MQFLSRGFLLGMLCFEFPLNELIRRNVPSYFYLVRLPVSEPRLSIPGLWEKSFIVLFILVIISALEGSVMAGRKDTKIRRGPG